MIRHEDHKEHEEKTQGKKYAFSLGVLCVLCGYLLFGYRLGDRDLWASHEARAAQDAQRILDDGDWLSPRLFDGQPELQKPPLYYWLVAAAGWLRGGTVDAVAVRLPAALAGLTTVLVVFVFLAASGRPAAGLLAAVILATAQHFTWISRTGRIDAPLTFTVTTSILCLWAAETAGRPVFLSLTSAFTMASGILLKGPLGLVLPVAVLAADAIVGRRPLPRSLAWLLPLAVAIAAPWFVIAHLRTHGEFTRVFFWYHNVQRATGGSAALASHPWWYYGPRFVLDFLPWSPLLVGACWFKFRARRLPNDPTARFGSVWLATILLLLSLARFKRADYLLPAYPGAAIWLGCVGERMLASARPRSLALGIAGTLGTICVGWVLFLHLVVPRWEAAHGERQFALAVREAVPRPELVLLFRVENHLLAWHLRRPLNTFLEWENLNVWAGRPGTHFVLMPAECADVWRQYITSGDLDEVLRYTDRTDRHKPRDLVLVRTRPTIGTDGSADRSTESQQRADQRPAAGFQPGGGAGGDR